MKKKFSKFFLEANLKICWKKSKLNKLKMISESAFTQTSIQKSIFKSEKIFSFLFDLKKKTKGMDQNWFTVLDPTYGPYACMLNKSRLACTDMNKCDACDSLKIADTQPTNLQLSSIGINTFFNNKRAYFLFMSIMGIFVNVLLFR